MIKRLLIPNRGEIACRIIKTAQRLGMQTIVAHSSIDAHSLAVQLSDESICIGFAPAADSYLNRDAVIAAAKKTHADAIHPGYGFLSEDAEFSQLCAMNNIIFVGPPAKAITSMADKTAAKRIMQQAGVPITPGYLGEQQDLAAFTAAAQKIGFPILIKATAGGGGKGMRLVSQLEQLADAIAGAKREALKSFGNDHVFLEKYVDPARHIEIQIFTDAQGNGVHLFERDCSAQRRHQKIIEEAPASHLKTKTRQAMTDVAVKAALAIDYVGAGTMEFLVDDNENFYFMEMNTRLQVEHPVTEMVTGIDLVEWQLRIAAGESLPLPQKEIKTHGHAIEARIYAEDPSKGFTPSIGKITHYTMPNGENVRIDSGIQIHDSIRMYYDPMIAKLIVWGSDRHKALARLQHALRETYITGVKTNVSFLNTLLQQDIMHNQQLSTQFIDSYQEALTQAPLIPDVTIVSAAISYYQSLQTSLLLHSTDVQSPWQQRSHWRLNKPSPLILDWWVNEKKLTIALTVLDKGYTVTWNNKSHTVHGNKIDNKHPLAHTIIDSAGVHVFAAGEHYIFSRHNHTFSTATTNNAEKTLLAPMPGAVIDICVQPGQNVKAGQKLIVLEAMKMEHTLYATNDAVIARVMCKTGEQLSEGTELIEFTHKA